MSNPEDPHLSELVRGASLAFANAEQLFSEAKILSARKAFSRALFFHQISLEECGKTEILGWWATGHLMGIAVDFEKIRSRLTRHKVKNFVNAYMLPLSEAEQKARDESDWKREHEAFKEQQAAFHQESNDRKNASLYVDIVDNAFLCPTDRITEAMVHEIADRNNTFIELMRPKVEMLRYWEQDPDGTRESMKGFQQLMEELRENNPDDPRKAFNALLTEILVQLKKAQQGAEGDAVNRAP
jgi:AbiV family abortive infection protein